LQEGIKIAIIALPSPNSKLYIPVLNYLTKRGTSLPPLNKRELYIKAKQDTIIFSRGWDIPVVKNYPVGIKYMSFICYPTRDSNGEKRAKA